MNVDSLFQDPAFALHYDDMVRCLTARKKDERRAKIYLGLMIERAGVMPPPVAPKPASVVSDDSDDYLDEPEEDMTAKVISDLESIAPQLNAGASRSYVLPASVSFAHIVSEIARGALRVPVPTMLTNDGQQVMVWGEMPGMDGATVWGG